MPCGKTIVVGVGNILLKDEGIGVHVIRELGARDLPGHVELIEGGTSALSVLSVLAEAGKVILVDAVRGGQKPGTIYRCTPQDLAIEGCALSSVHELGPLETLTAAKRLGYEPPTVIIGVEPEAIEWGMEPSATLAEKMPEILRAVLREV